ncbi:MAG: YXWGXW repeat-containing protein [Acidobacteria bacterium]|nr:YXWGXW repeat-containing protein [Acidobacteriota bacterium]
MRKRTWLLALILTIGATTGCAVRATYASYARVPPPPPGVEVYGLAPGPGHVWVNGYWAWRGGGYAWAPGYWARPPRPHARWAPGQWVYRHGGYYYQPGGWR